MTKKECVEALKKKYKNLPDDQKQFFIAKALDEKQVYKVRFDKVEDLIIEQKNHFYRKEWKIL